jgi:hypothetical protein
MKKVLFVLLLAATGAHAEYHDEPFKEFDATRNQFNTVTIVWRQAADVTQACNIESRKRGNSGFGFNVLGCEFHHDTNNTRVCTIITPLNTTLTNLGHETRHCFQGSWHGL